MKNWSTPNWLVAVSLHPQYWRRWMLGLGIVSGSISVLALLHLIRLPGEPNCWTISWRDTISGTRLYCAEELSRQQTPENLEQAIKLAHLVPMDDPLRDQSDRFIDHWSRQMLQLGEEAFQAGDLHEAIDIAERIPKGLWTYRLSKRKVEQWRSTWAKAEQAYKAAERKIEKKNWYGALVEAKQLLLLGNHYWETEKYNELMHSLQAEKERHEWDVNATNPKPVQRESIDQTIADWDKKREQEAVQQLEQAQRLAQTGDVKALEAGIAAAEKITYGTASYEAAQAAIDTWQTQVETMQDRPNLDRATQLAATGDPTSLQAAIEVAEQITWGRALHDEAQSRIENWRDTKYQLEFEQRSAQLDTLLDHRSNEHSEDETSHLEHNQAHRQQEIRSETEAIDSLTENHAENHSVEARPLENRQAENKE